MRVHWAQEGARQVGWIHGTTRARSTCTSGPGCLPIVNDCCDTRPSRRHPDAPNRTKPAIRRVVLRQNSTGALVGRASTRQQEEKQDKKKLKTTYHITSHHITTHQTPFRFDSENVLSRSLENIHTPNHTKTRRDSTDLDDPPLQAKMPH